MPELDDLDYVAVSSNGHSTLGRGDASRIVGFGPVEKASLNTMGQSRKALLGGAALFDELGRTGLRHWGGFVFEEWLRELQTGRRAAEVYRQMSDEDPVIGGILYAIKMLCRRVSWYVEPASSSAKDVEYAKNVWDMFNDLDHSWYDLVSEILSYLAYGWGYYEIVWKMRKGWSNNVNYCSKYDDGLIAPRKLSLRSQDSLWKWVFSEDGTIEGLIQNPPPDYQLRYIPIQKAMHFRTEVFKDSPEGRSVLRNSYTPWYFARNMRAIEGIGVERDLCGLPVLTPPEGVDIWDAEDQAMAAIRQQAQNVVSSIRRDEQEGVVLPFGWTLDLMRSGGRRQFDVGAIIMRYELRIASSVLADIILIGQDKVGSYALADQKVGLLDSSTNAYLDQIAGVFNTQLIPKIYALNGWKGATDFCQLQHGIIESHDLQSLGTFLLNLHSAGLTMFGDNDPDNVFTEHVLNLAGLPVPSLAGTAPNPTVATAQPAEPAANQNGASGQDDQSPSNIGALRDAVAR